MYDNDHDPKKTDNTPPVLLTLRQVCIRCGVSMSTCRRWVKGGLLPVVVLPAQNLRVRYADLEEFIEAHIDQQVA